MGMTEQVIPVSLLMAIPHSASEQQSKPHWMCSFHDLPMDFSTVIMVWPKIIALVQYFSIIIIKLSHCRDIFFHAVISFKTVFAKREKRENWELSSLRSSALVKDGRIAGSLIQLESIHYFSKRPYKLRMKECSKSPCYRRAYKSLFGLIKIQFLTSKPGWEEGWCC